MSSEHIQQLYAKEEAVRNSIVDSLIERSRAGEIDWNFSKIEENIYMFLITTNIGGYRFNSYHEQGSGIKLEAYKEEEEKFKLIRFSYYDAVRFRKVLGELASEDPVVIQIRKELEEKRQRDREEGVRRTINELENLKKIDKLLKRSSRS